MSNAAIFLDKDGTLINNVPYNVDPNQIVLCTGVNPGLKLLSQAGFQLIVVSNQSGIARGFFPESAIFAVETRLRDLLQKEAGVSLAGFYYCPHHPEGIVKQYAMACSCRKPDPGLLQQAARDLDINLQDSWMIGDILDDVEAGRRAGCQTILINNGNENEWVIDSYREPHYIVPNLGDAALIILSIMNSQQGEESKLLVERRNE
jgi:D-glycero-D-manno-heptose 1,7-bisphosphate phosphatase